MRIGLTGGIGCGVTAAARRLTQKGVPVLSGDEAGHVILASPDVKRELGEAFGPGIVAAAGEIDRERLGEIIFANETARKKFNGIVHPQLLDLLTSEAREAEAQSGIAVVDAALIYEWGLAGFFQKIIVVSAPLEPRIRRSMARTGLSREQVWQRLAAQWPLEKKLEKADFVIDNQGTLDELYAQVDEIWEAISQASI